MLLVAVCLLVAFVAFERLAAQPLLPLRDFKSRALSVANGAMVLFAGSIYAVMFFLSLYLQQVLGYSPLEGGWPTSRWRWASSSDRSGGGC